VNVLEATSKKVEPASAEAQLAEILKRADRKLVGANEAKTRVTLIDRILAALGWSTDDVERELKSGVGNYLDYELRAQGRPWMLVEAKRAGATFELPAFGKAGSTSLHSLQSLHQRGSAPLRDALAQAATYCNDRGVPLAAVTNGYQWLFFRGLSRRGAPWIKGVALTFFSPLELQNRFEEFFGALSRTHAHGPFLFQLLDRPGSRPPAIAKRPRELLRTRRHAPDPNRVSGLRTVADLLLTEIHGQNKGEMLERCYIEPGTTSEFARSIQRLLKDSETPIERLANETIAGDTAKFVEEVSRREKSVRLGQPVIVVGHVGAGKTTFIHRALGRVRDDRSAVYAFVDLEGHGKGGTIDVQREEDRVCALVLDKLGNATTTVLKHREDISESERLQANPLAPETLRTIFREDIHEERRLGEKLWAADPAAWPKREYELLSKAKSDHQGLLIRFLRHLRGRFRREDDLKYPVLIVLDNLDQATDDYQRCIYGLAQRIAKETPAVVVVSIREDTFRRGLAPGGFLTSSSLPFVFHVGAPPLDRVVKQRVKFARSGELTPLLPGPLRSDAGPLDELCTFVEQILLKDRAEALTLLACLAGSNVRNGLDLVRSVVVGTPTVPREPEPSATFALDAMFAALGEEQMQGRRFLANCFDAEPSSPSFHALRTRLLAYYAWTYELMSERALLESVDGATARFASWGYPVGIVHGALRALRSDGLLRAFEESEHGPQSLDPNLPARLTITASGDVHLRRLLPLPAYRAAMAITARWYDDGLADEFVKRADAAGGEEGPTIGDVAASSALAVFDSYLSQSLVGEDNQLVPEKATDSWIAEVRSRTAAYLPRMPDTVPTSPLPKALAPRIEDGSQLLLLGSEPATAETVLPTIPQDKKHLGTSWVPRILWALEWARLSRQGPCSASDVARILDTRGGINVPNTNVARAFRDLHKVNEDQRLWVAKGKRYTIDDAGRRALDMLMKEDP
jgi:hypothetical protein